MNDISQPFIRLVEIIAKLRDPQGGCPWDLEQTHQSLKPYVIEEAYEVVEAIDESPQSLSSELGDLLIQVLLHAQIASEAGNFDIGTVIEKVSEKLIYRHPHVFGDMKVEGSGEVLKNWEQLKQKQKGPDESVLDGVPRAMPALLRAQRIGEKAARIGFDWHDIKGVSDKVFEEIAEFLEKASGPKIEKDAEEEFGDLMFALTQWARKQGLNSEDLLNQASNKFTARFKYMEKVSAKPLKELSAEELEELWQRAKKAL
ncbi:MAG: nucleoside triphosphate pyrophosphohydrolase [Proteobacteria bacterium]|nr:MAG: nucleoside triphosphate pyrophosphohydrolase [Pseudomonadota bacterium]